MLLESALYRDICLDCGCPILARSTDALAAAQRDHVDYVNAKADRTQDPHFHTHRLDALMAYSHERQ